MNAPIITHCTQAQIEQILRMRKNGNTWGKIAKTTKRGISQVRRYGRIFEEHGIGAFAEKKGRT